MPNPLSHDRRHEILVDQKFQIGFILRLGTTLVLAFGLVFVLCLIVPLLLGARGSSADWVGAEIWRRLEVLRDYVMTPLLCSLLILFAHGILETFKIAGPHHRYQKLLRGMQDLRIPSGVRTRKSDHLQETSQALDGACRALHEQLGKCQALSRDIRTALLKSTPGAVERGSRVSEMLAELDVLLAEFRLEDRPAPSPAEEPVEPLPPVAVLHGSEDR